MLKFIKNNQLFVILIHIVLGFLFTLPLLPTLYTALIIIFGSIYIIINKNNNEQAVLMASYLCGAEVFIRMTKGILLYETGKYGVMLFLFLGAYYGKNSAKPNLMYVYYILLLLIGIAFTDVPPTASVRKDILFNLSGPILTGIAALYFYQRKVKLSTLYDSLFMMILPIIAMTSYLYFRTPDLSEIVFRGVANYKTSGDFGPNQVATALGVGIFISAVFLLTSRKLTGFVFLDIAVLIYLIYRGLITFSRGGIITAGFCVILFAFFYLFSKGKILENFFKVFAITVIAAIGIWLYTSNITGGMLENRYLGKNARGVQKKDITTGRLDILYEQFNSLVENPFFGIGVGSGKYKRQSGIKKVTGASHNEIGRLLEEHGAIGVLSLVLLFVFPAIIFFRVSAFHKAFLCGFFFFWLLTIGHSAMRIAFPGFVYGLCLIKIIKDE